MKLTKHQLRQIIKEELMRTLHDIPQGPLDPRNELGTTILPHMYNQTTTDATTPPPSLSTSWHAASEQDIEQSGDLNKLIHYLFSKLPRGASPRSTPRSPDATTQSPPRDTSYTQDRQMVIDALRIAAPGFAAAVENDPNWTPQQKLIDRLHGIGGNATLWTQEALRNLLWFPEAIK